MLYKLSELYSIDILLHKLNCKMYDLREGIYWNDVKYKDYRKMKDFNEIFMFSFSRK